MFSAMLGCLSEVCAASGSRLTAALTLGFPSAPLADWGSTFPCGGSAVRASECKPPGALNALASCWLAQRVWCESRWNVWSQSRLCWRWSLCPRPMLKGRCGAATHWLPEWASGVQLDTECLDLSFLEARSTWAVCSGSGVTEWRHWSRL